MQIAYLVQRAKFRLLALTRNTIVAIAHMESTNQAGLDAPPVRRMHGRLKAAQHPPIVNVTMARRGRMEDLVHSAQRESIRTRGVRGVMWAVLIIIAKSAQRGSIIHKSDVKMIALNVLRTRTRLSAVRL